MSGKVPMVTAKIVTRRPVKSKESNGLKETPIQKTIKDYLDLRPDIDYFRINTMGDFHTVGGRSFRKKNENKGMADLLVLKNPFTIWIETKSNNGKQSENQAIFEQKVTKHNHFYIIVTSVHQVIEFLKLLEKQ